jgi:transposase InsO family protein
MVPDHAKDVLLSDRQVKIRHLHQAAIQRFVVRAVLNLAVRRRLPPPVAPVGDDFTRECLAIDVATSFPARQVIGGLARLVQGPGEARVPCEGFRREHNEERPHQSLGYLTSQEFKQQWLQTQSRRSPDPGD